MFLNTALGMFFIVCLVVCFILVLERFSMICGRGGAALKFSTTAFLCYFTPTYEQKNVSYCSSKTFQKKNVAPVPTRLNPPNLNNSHIIEYV